MVRQQEELSAKLANKSEPHRPNKGQVKFVADTAKKTGQSKRAVERDKARGENIAKDVQKEIAGTTIEDSGVQLDALAAATPEQQREAVKAVNLGHMSRMCVRRCPVPSRTSGIGSIVVGGHVGLALVPGNGKRWLTRARSLRQPVIERRVAQLGPLKPTTRVARHCLP